MVISFLRWWKFPLLVLGIIPLTPWYPNPWNAMLFYLVWTGTIWTYRPWQVILFGTLIIKIIFYYIPSLAMFLFDICFPSTSEHFKKRGRRGLPATDSRRWPSLAVYKVVMWAAINTCLALVSQLGLDWILTNATGCRSMLRLTTNMPMPWGTFWKILFAFFGREVLTYLSHRWLLHWRTDAYVGFDVVPVYLSSWHRSWYHSLHTLYPFTAHYDHPGAYIFGRFLPQYIPVVFMRMHCLEYFLYITIVSLEELCVYSGYGTDLTRLSIGVSSKWFIGGWEVQAHEHLMNRRINFSPWGLGDALAGAFQGERVSPPRPQSQPSQSRSQLEAQRGQYHVTARDMTRRR